jgi:Pentapeptide repeats (8 copies)
MVYSDPTVDRIEASFKSLADDVNRTSASTRNGWVFFLALQAYFFIALAGITHRDLLLDTAIPLPLLQVPIGLQGFFLFGPFILVLVHMGILLQHVMLARQARELHNRVASFEGRGLFRNHGVRTHVHPYVFTQLIAGPQRSGFFAFFLLLLTWLSLGILPIVLLLDFQVTFLPYHDLHVTWTQRAALILDILMLAVFAVFMRYPALTFTAGFGRTIVERPVSVVISLILAGGAMFFALSVATIPGERMDRAMASIWPTDIADAHKDRGQARQAFWLTALLFEGAVDPLSGRPTSLFGRNLVVTDVDLVKDNAFDEGETSINLRMRDLRYGVFDRTDLHQADFTGANLTQASLREANLVEAKAEKAMFRGADLWRVQALPSTSTARPVTGIDLREADLRGASLVQANLQGALLDGALLEGADFRGAQMDPQAAAEAKKQGANF